MVRQAGSASQSRPNRMEISRRDSDAIKANGPPQAPPRDRPSKSLRRFRLLTIRKVSWLPAGSQAGTPLPATVRLCPDLTRP